MEQRMNHLNQKEESEVERLIEDSVNGRKQEEQQVLADQHHSASWDKWHRWFRIGRLLSGAFLLVMGSISVSVYVLDERAGGNSDALVGVAFGVIGALWLVLHMARRKDLGWLGEALRGFQN